MLTHSRSRRCIVGVLRPSVSLSLPQLVSCRIDGSLEGYGGMGVGESGEKSGNCHSRNDRRAAKTVAPIIGCLLDS